MSLVRWEPVREIADLQQEMNRIFGSFFDATAGGDGGFNGNGVMRRWVPALDLVEEGDDFVLKVDLPGMSHEDVRIEVEDRILTLAGERRSEHTDKKDGFIRLERSFGSFRRQMTLPEGVDPDALSATFDNGVLEVRIPKPEEHRPRRVQIAVGEQPRTLEG